MVISQALALLTGMGTEYFSHAALLAFSNSIVPNGSNSDQNKSFRRGCDVKNIHRYTTASFTM